MLNKNFHFHNTYIFQFLTLKPKKKHAINLCQKKFEPKILKTKRENAINLRQKN